MTNGNFFNYQSNEFSRIGSGFAGEFCFRFYTKVSLKWDFSRQKKDRGRNETLVCLAPPSEPDLRISRIRLSS